MDEIGIVGRACGVEREGTGKRWGEGRSEGMGAGCWKIIDGWKKGRERTVERKRRMYKREEKNRKPTGTRTVGDI